MAITRIKNNQITDTTIVASEKVSGLSVTSGLLENDLTYGSNLTVTGNLTVNGTTTTVNSTNTTVEDPILVLASQQTGAGAVDIGFIGERGTDTNVAFVWDESLSKFRAGFVNEAESNTVVTFSAGADMQVAAFTATGTTTLAGLDIPVGDTNLTALNVTGLSSLDGGIDVDGAFTVADTTGNILTTGTLGAGSTTLSSLTVNGLSDLNGGIAVDGTNFTVDGTTGAVSTTSTLGVTGTSTLGVINATGLASLDGGIDVDGVFTVADLTGNVVAGGSITANSTTDLNGLLTVADTTWDALSTIDGGANKITNIADPTLDQDAATKAYVDTIAGSGFTLTGDTGSTTISGGDTLAVTGTAGETTVVAGAGVDTLVVGLATNVQVAGTLGVTGATTLTGILNADGGIAVDTSNFTVNGTTGAVATASTLDVAGLASLDGGIDVDGAFTVANTTGNISTTGTANVDGLSTLNDVTLDALSTFDAGANALTNVADPSNPQDASTKAYVDSVAATGFTLNDGTSSDTISGGDTLVIQGTALEVEVGFTAVDTLTIGLPDAVTLTGVLSADGGIDVDGAFIVADTSGNISTTGTLDVTGDTTLEKADISELVITETIVATTNFVNGVTYEITTVGDTDFTLIGASANTVGVIFTATGPGTGTTGAAKLAGTVDMGGNRVTNIAEPTQAQDATSKAYVDAGLSGLAFTIVDDGVGSQPISGGETITFNSTANEIDVVITATDQITFSLPDDVTIGNDLTITGATNAAAINATGLASLDGGIDVDGVFTVADATGNVSTTGTMNVDGITTLADVTIDAASTLDMGANKVTNMADPTVAQDAATKVYVDNLVSSSTVWKDPVTDTDLADVVSVNPATPEADYGLTVGSDCSFIATAAITFSLGTGSTVVGTSAGDIVNLTITSTGNGDYTLIETPLSTGDRFIIGAEHITAQGILDSALGQIDIGADDATVTDGNFVVGDTYRITTVGTTDFIAIGASADTVGVSFVATGIGGAGSGAALDVTNNIKKGDLIEFTGTGNGTTAASWSFPEGRSGLAAGETEIVQGITVLCSDPDSVHYGHTYLYNADTDSWVEITGPGSIAAGTNLEYAGNTLNVSPQGAGSFLDADLLDGQEGTYYLDWTNTTNKPDPVITLGGDATGSITMTDLAGGTLTVTVVDDSHAHIIANVDGLQTALDGKLLNTGDTMDGAYTVDAAIGSISWATSPSLDAHLANKGYVDSLVEAGWTITDGVTPQVIAGSDTLTVNGTANEVNVAVTATDTLTIGLPDDVTIGGALTVTTGAALNGGITVDTNAFIVADGTGNTTIAGTLNTAGLATLDGGIAVDSSNFTVSGTTGAVSTASTLNADGAVTFGADVTLTGGVGDVFLIQDGTSGTTFSVDTTNGNTVVAGTMDSAGLASLNGGIAVDGTAFTVADVTGNVATDGTLTVTGLTDLNGGLQVGAVTLDALSVFDAGANKLTNLADPALAQDAATKAYVDATASTGFTLTDGTTPTTISGGDTLTLSGTASEVEVVTGVDTVTIGLPDNVQIAGTLGVTGIATMTALLNANGGIAVDGTNFTVDGTTGAMATLSTATVGGLANLNGGIAVDGTAFTVADTTGNVASTGTLTVAGLTTLNGGITADAGAFTVADTTGNVATTGTLGVTGLTTTTDINATGVVTVTGSAAIDNVTIDGNDISATAGTELTINDAGGDFNFRVEGNGNANALFVDAGSDSVNVGTAAILTDVEFQVGGNTSSILSTGTTLERPSVGIAGMMRYNTVFNQYEFFDGTVWATFGTEFTIIASETFAGDDLETAFTLASAQTTASCIVSINGVVQLPTTAYGVVGTTLTFTEAPATGDVIEVRELTTTTSVNGVSDGGVTIQANTTQFDITGHMIPSADVTYDLGSLTNRWKDLYLSGTTIDLGGVKIKNVAGTVTFLQSNGVDPAPVDLGTTLDPDVTLDGGSY